MLGLRPEQYFPTFMVVLSLGSAAGYALSGDPRKTIYWLAAAVLTASVTY